MANDDHVAKVLLTLRTSKTCPPDLHQRMQHAAHAKRMSMNAFVLQAVISAVKHTENAVTLPMEPTSEPKPD